MAKPDQFRSAAAVADIEAETSRTGNDYRALVCVFLNGGNDSHNMVVPRAGTNNRIHYDLQRGAVVLDPDTGEPLPKLAIEAGLELPLTADWGLNPNMPGTAALFETGRMGILMNVGLLAKPISRAEYKSKTVPEPSQLFAHNSQQALWQSLPFLGQTDKTGYMGRTDDLVGEFFNFSAVDDINGQFSISGRPLQMQGFEARSNDLSTSGPSSATASAANVPAQYLGPARTRQAWNNRRQALFASAVKGSVFKQAAITAGLQTMPSPAAAPFTGLVSGYGNLAGQLQMVARVMNSRANFGHRRDMFFVSMGGWDDHDGITQNYSNRLGHLDAALSAFYQSLTVLGLNNNVVTYTQSDFGRALKQNNDGSDHGWGGHALIMGDPVIGGHLYGTPPDLSPGSTNDADQGRMIPTTSADQYVATMLKWFGVPESQLEVVLPNLVHFSQKTLPMLNEPVPVVVQPKAFSLDLVTEMVNNGKLPDNITHSRPVHSVSSQFDRDGNMIPSPTNALPNSEFIGGEAFVGQVLSSSSTLGWRIAASDGIQIQLVGVGEEDGVRFSDWRVFGTAAVTSYPQIGMSPYATVAGSITAGLGHSWTCFAKIRRLPGAPAQIPGNVTLNIRGTTATGASISGHDINSTVLPPTEFETQLMRVAFHATDAACARVHARVMTPVVAGATVDETFRISEPHMVPGIWVDPVPYVPSFGEPVALPRLDFDPASGRIRGVLRDIAKANVLRNSIFAGGTAGFPGVAPISQAITSVVPGLTISFGLKKTVNKIPLMTVRIFGKATAAGSLVYELDTTAATVAPGASEDWVASIYARRVAGSFAGLSAASLSTLGLNSGASVEQGLGDLSGLTDARLVGQRVFAPTRFLNATVNQVKARLAFTPVVGEYVDLTLEFGAPQLEKGRSASSWIPTGPSGTLNATGGQFGLRANEIIDTAPSNFGWFNPAEGSLVIKGEVMVGQAATQNSFPRFAGFTDGTLGNQLGVYALSSADPAFNGRSGASAVVGNAAQGANNSVLSPVIANGKPATRVISYSAGYLQTAQRGALGAATTPPAFPTVDRLSIGFSLDAPVWLQSVDYYATKLTPTEMTVLTSS